MRAECSVWERRERKGCEDSEPLGSPHADPVAEETPRLRVSFQPWMASGYFKLPQSRVWVGAVPHLCDGGSVWGRESPSITHEPQTAAPVSPRAQRYSLWSPWTETRANPTAFSTAL